MPSKLSFDIRDREVDSPSIKSKQDCSIFHENNYKPKKKKQKKFKESKDSCVYFLHEETQKPDTNLKLQECFSKMQENKTNTCHEDECPTFQSEQNFSSVSENNYKAKKKKKSCLDLQTVNNEEFDHVAILENSDKSKRKKKRKQESGISTVFENSTEYDRNLEVDGCSEKQHMKHNKVHDEENTKFLENSEGRKRKKKKKRESVISPVFEKSLEYDRNLDADGCSEEQHMKITKAHDKESANPNLLLQFDFSSVSDNQNSKILENSKGSKRKKKKKRESGISSGFENSTESDKNFNADGCYEKKHKKHHKVHDEENAKILENSEGSKRKKKKKRESGISSVFENSTECDRNFDADGCSEKQHKKHNKVHDEENAKILENSEGSERKKKRKRESVISLGFENSTESYKNFDADSCSEKQHKKHSKVRDEESAKIVENSDGIKRKKKRKQESGISPVFEKSTESDKNLDADGCSEEQHMKITKAHDKESANPNLQLQFDFSSVSDNIKKPEKRIGCELLENSNAPEIEMIAVFEKSHEEKNKSKLHKHKKKKRKYKESNDLNTAEFESLTVSDNSADEETCKSLSVHSNQDFSSARDSEDGSNVLDCTEEPVNFPIPPLHELNSSTMSITKEERSFIESQGITVKHGKFTSSEDAILKRNFQEICSTLKVDPSLLLGIGKKRNPAFCNFLKAKNFYIRLGKDLNNRRLQAVYARARRLFNPYRRNEKNTKEEIKMIMEYQKSFGNKYTHIGGLLEKSDSKVKNTIEWNSKYVKKGEWSSDEEEMLTKAIQSLVKIPNLSGQHSDLIPWPKVAELVPNRNASQCRLHWGNCMAWEPDAKKKPWLREQDYELFNELISRSCINECEIDWKDVHKKFKDFTPSHAHLRQKFRKLKKTKWFQGMLQMSGLPMEGSQAHKEVLELEKTKAGNYN